MSIYSSLKAAMTNAGVKVSAGEDLVAADLQKARDFLFHAGINIGEEFHRFEEFAHLVKTPTDAPAPAPVAPVVAPIVTPPAPVVAPPVVTTVAPLEPAPAQVDPVVPSTEASTPAAE